MPSYRETRNYHNKSKINGHPGQYIFHDLSNFHEVSCVSKKSSKKIELHTSADASNQEVGAIVMAIVHQESGTCKGWVATKSRLSKDLKIPRLKPISGHKATNLFYNVKEVLDGFPFGNVFELLDSALALH